MAHVAILYSSAVAYVGVLYMGICVLAIVLPGETLDISPFWKKEKNKKKKTKRESVPFIISPAG